MYRRILVATDGSETASRAVDRAVSVASATGAALTILSAGDAAQTGAVLEAEQRRLAGSGVEIDVLASDRDAASAILEAAAAGDYDLVVLGNQGMTGPARLATLGSVPNKVSHRLTRSLLIVKTS